ncbi:efflux RND transporter periplasmic adaptor subunit [Anaeromicropila populeti]|uniref:Multidrug efflux pump subunit AcrA (Membrane-fusion protein) n=1 Tax=Anaeromicropila populeti TaxID=37658 RepID=A0A1I6IXE8_9FIRM|nr:hypothetical protein [Anaeromicropila populeti]SFR71331.1 Multidrug efflux pump subunit AcrA (membrane-fusion protein) [Anaeromicropila populeti]
MSGKIRGKSLFVLGMCIFLTGCALLPPEENVRYVSAVPDKEENTYEYTLVKQGDLKERKEVVCTYKAAEQKTLSFHVSAIEYGEVYVRKGESVEEGEVLAVLKTEDLDEKMEKYQSQVRDLELEKDKTEKIFEIEKKKYNLGGAQKETLEDYENELRTLKKNINHYKNYIEECTKEKEDRQLIAPMNGIVSKIFDYTEGSVSVAGKDFITLSSEENVFTAKVSEQEEFPVEEIYEMWVGEESHRVKVMSKKNEKSLWIVTFQLIDPIYNMENFLYGSIWIERNQLKNVLYVEEKAVFRSGGKNYAYIMGQTGEKEIRMLDVGKTVNGFVEIKSGLEKNEKVILS